MEYYKTATDHMLSLIDTIHSPSKNSLSYYFKKDPTGLLQAATCDMCFITMQTVDSILRNSLF